MPSLTDIAQSVVAGVGYGSIDALLAIGIVLIFRTTGVLNFAQAATGTFGGYVIYAVATGRPLWLGLAVGIATGAALAVATNVTVSGMRSRDHALTAAVATLAIAILLAQVVRISWGTTVGSYPQPWGVGAFTVGGVTVAYLYVAALICALGLALLIAALLRWTRSGTMIRAISDHAGAAAACGANVGILVAAVWAVAGAVATVASFFAFQILFEPSGLDTFFIGALIASVLGGLRSLPLAFVGAVLIEVAKNLFQLYGPVDLAPYAQTFTLAILILVLVLVPRRWLASGTARVV
jgi:branched-chain amino acid transport system permease protein